MIDCLWLTSPIHLLTKDDEDMLKKVALMLLAIALPISVLPVPAVSTQAVSGCLDMNDPIYMYASFTSILHAGRSMHAGGGGEGGGGGGGL